MALGRLKQRIGLLKWPRELFRDHRGIQCMAERSRDVQSDRDGNPVHLAHNVQLRCTPRPTCCENAQSLCLK